MRILIVLLAALSVGASLVLSLSTGAGAATIPDRWDDDFRRAAARWLPAVSQNAALLKAQCWQESRLNPLARSPVGACGLCQFMPGTWAETTKRLGIVAACTDPHASIESAGYYMAQLRRGVAITIPGAPEPEHHKISLAGYNAGPGNINRAAKACGSPRIWAAIVPCLASITGRHAQETIDYVRLIFERWLPMIRV